MTDLTSPRKPYFPTLGRVLFAPWRAACWLWRAGRWLWRKLWRPLLGLLLLLIIAHIALNIIAGRRLAAELNRLRAAGEPLRVSELAPPEIPDAENAALIYEGPFERLKNEQGQDLLARFLFASRHPSAPGPPPTLGQAKAILARHEDDFRLLDQASRMPGCRFPVDWDNPMAAVFPHLAGLRAATRFLTYKAVLDAREGRGNEAWAALSTALRMNDQVTREPTLISVLVRVACIKILFSAFPRVLADAPPTPDQARSFSGLLANFDMMRGYARAMQAERCCGIWEFDYVRRGRLKDVLTLSAGESERSDLWLRALARLGIIGRLVWEPLRKLDELYYLRSMRDWIALAEQPYASALHGYERLGAKRLVSYDVLEEQMQRGPWYAVLTRNISPVFSRAHAARDEAIAILRLMQTALALHSYRLEHAGYPASLEELTPGGVPSFALDPFADRPLLYQREGTGYLLYSIGKDLADNGGVDRETAIVRTRRGFPDYDLPLRLPAKLPRVQRRRFWPPQAT